MNTVQEHSPKKASQAAPTIEEIKELDEGQLLKWIQKEQPKLLKGDKLKKFKATDISGEVFLNHAGDVEFFQKECNLTIGLSERLADLARKIAGRETAGIKSKLLSSMPRTPR